MGRELTLSFAFVGLCAPQPIISLAEAQSNTPWTARIEHGVKRWLWL